MKSWLFLKIIFSAAVLSISSPTLFSMEEREKQESKTTESHQQTYYVSVGEKVFSISQDILEKIKAINNVVEFSEDQVTEENPVSIDTLFPNAEAIEQNQEMFEKIIKLLTELAIREEEDEQADDFLNVSDYSMEQLVALLNYADKLDVECIIPALAEECANRIEVDNLEKIDEKSELIAQLHILNPEMFAKVLSHTMLAKTLPFLSAKPVVVINTPNPVRHIAFDKESEKLAFVFTYESNLDHRNERICIVDMISKKIDVPLCYQTADWFAKIGSLCFTNNGKLVTALAKMSCFWDVEQKKRLTQQNDNSCKILYSTLSPDNALLAEISEQNHVIIRHCNEEDREKNKVITHLVHPRFSVTHATFNNDGTILAIADMSGSVYLWNIEQLKVSKGMDDQKPIITCKVDQSVETLKFHPAEPLLCVACGNSVEGKVHLWNIKSNKCVGRFTHCGSVVQAKFNHTGIHLYTADASGVHLFDVNTKREIVDLPSDGRIYSCDISADESMIAVGTARKMTLWKVNPHMRERLTPASVQFLIELSKSMHQNKALRICKHTNSALFDIYQAYGDLQDLNTFIDHGCDHRCLENVQNLS